jgi:hypothetical protein
VQAFSWISQLKGLFYLRLGAAERPAPDLEGDTEREGWEGLLCWYCGLLCWYPCERC